MASTDSAKGYPLAVTNKSHSQLFIARMRRAGQYQQYCQAIKDKMAAAQAAGTPMAMKVARQLVEVEMGRMGLNEERDMFLAAQRQEGIPDDPKVKAAREKHRYKAKLNAKKRKAQDFATALDVLDNQKSAPLEEELDWVRNHPKMAARAVEEDKTRLIIIEPDDVLCPGHGEAPSRGAALMLQHYVNEPQKFMDMYINQKKKASAVEKEGPGAMYSDNLDECIATLKKWLEIEGGE